jgi:hypothetical protein
MKTIKNIFPAYNVGTVRFFFAINNEPSGATKFYWGITWAKIAKKLMRPGVATIQHNGYKHKCVRSFTLQLPLISMFCFSAKSLFYKS